MNGKIYVIRNRINDKVYIGQTIQDVKDRFKQHLKMCKSNRGQVICKAIKKYGKNNFYVETLEDGILTYEKLNSEEERFISEFDSMIPNGYNMCPGGQKWRRKKSIDRICEKKICDEYESGSSSDKIAKENKISKYKVLRILHENNINVRPKNCNLPDRTSIATKEKLLYMLSLGKTVKEMSEEIGISERGISRAISKFNLREYNSCRKTRA